MRESSNGCTSVFVGSRDRLEVSISSALVELGLGMANFVAKESERRSGLIAQSAELPKRRGDKWPYRIVNSTGWPVQVAINLAELGGKAPQDYSGPTQIDDGKTLNFRFDDWQTLRDVLLLLLYCNHMSHTFLQHLSITERNHSLVVVIVGKAWELPPKIAVDREGEQTYILRPTGGSKSSQRNPRLVVEVRVEDNIKVVTLRSTCKVQNHTLYPIDVSLRVPTGSLFYEDRKLGASPFSAVVIVL